MVIAKAESPINYCANIHDFLELVQEKEMCALLLAKVEKIPSIGLLTSLKLVGYDLELSKLVIAKTESPINAFTTTIGLLELVPKKEMRTLILAKVEKISGYEILDILKLVGDDLELSKLVIAKTESPIDAFTATTGLLELVPAKELRALILAKVEKVPGYEIVNILKLVGYDLELSKLVIAKTESPIKSFATTKGLLELVPAKETRALILEKVEKIPGYEILDILKLVGYDLELSTLVIEKAESPIDSFATRSILELMGDNAGALASVIEAKAKANAAMVICEPEASSIALVGDVVRHEFISSEAGFCSCMPWIYSELEY